MPDADARAIVETALALLKTHPHAPPLEVLDLAMIGRHGTDPDFETAGQHFAEWTDPRGPFGELLRRAFASDVDCYDAADILRGNDPDDRDLRAAVREWWLVAVVLPFRERYQLGRAA